MSIKRATGGLSAAEIARLADKGLAAVRLDKKKKKAFLATGLYDIYSVFDMKKANIPPLDKSEVDRLTARFFPEPSPKVASLPVLWIKLKKTAIELADTVTDWSVGSPAFAYRSSEHQTVALHREIGHMTVHLEVVSRQERLADIRLLLTDERKRDKTSFEVELFRNDKCVEAVSGQAGKTVTLSRIETGEYCLKLSDAHGEITSLQIRMD